MTKKPKTLGELLYEHGLWRDAKSMVERHVGRPVDMTHDPAAADTVICNLISDGMPATASEMVACGRCGAACWRGLDIPATHRERLAVVCMRCFREDAQPS